MARAKENEKSKKKSRKGFASTLFAAMATFLLATTITAVLSLGFYQKNVSLLAEAQEASNRFIDSKNFLNETANDAAVDSAWASEFGCSGGNPFCSSLPARMQDYFTNSTNALTTQFVAVNYSNLSVYCADASPASGYNASYETSVAFFLSTTSKNVFKKEFVEFNKTVDVFGNGSVFRVRIRIGAWPVLKLSVACG